VIRKTLISMLALALLFLSAGSAMAKPESAGLDQLVEAFDAAWTRVVLSGKYREMILTFDEPATALPTGIQAQDYITNVSDCLPNTVLTPFPKANSVKGRFKEILDTGMIRRGDVLSSNPVTPGGTTSDWFSRGDPTGSGNDDQSEFLLTAILAEISAFYGIGPISVTNVTIPFPFNTTSALQDGIFGFSFGGPPPTIRSASSTCPG